MLFGLWLKNRRVTFLHQAGAALLLGMSGGLVMFFVSLGAEQERWIYEYGDYFVFDTEFFFLFLLPPIIFESGYALNAEPFFRNLGKILYFAFVGTMVGVGVFGLGMYAFGQLGLSHPFSFINAMMFGSIIGATDPVSVLAIFNDLRVDVDLFAVVFGESVLNDAVAVVLYRSMYTFEEDNFTLGGCLAAVWTFVVVFLGSTAIGVGIALASALFFKRFKLSDAGIHTAHPSVYNNNNHGGTNGGGGGGNGNGDGNGGGGGAGGGVGGNAAVAGEGDSTPTHKNGSPEDAVKGAVLEASVVMLFPWVAYMMAETLQLVGIVAILFCGIVMGHYTRRNLSEGGRALTMGIFGLMAQLSETFVFIYMGASVFLADRDFFGTAALVVLMCLIARAAAVYPGYHLINWNADREAAGAAAAAGVPANTPAAAARMPANHAHMLWFSGLRGAMAFALAMEASAKRGDDGSAMLTSTLTTVLFTTIGVGGLTVPMLHALGIQCGNATGFSGGVGGGARSSSYESIVQMCDSATADDYVGGGMRGNSSSGNLKSTMNGGSGGGVGRNFVSGVMNGMMNSGGGGNWGDDDSDTRVLISSDLSEGDARERSKVSRARAAGTYPSNESGKNNNSNGDGRGRGGHINRVTGMQRFKSLDERYLTPIFTLDEGDRDGSPMKH